MADRKTRVRFAPSPTGPLHMGGVRTALYNYFYAKQHGGDFILRIEDTDSNRFVPGAEAYIIESLKWCGICPDEGLDADGRLAETPSLRNPHAPYRQSLRGETYIKYAKEHVESGNAYYAFDTAEELAAKRSEAESEGRTFTYDHVTRMHMRNSLTLPQEEVQRLLETTSDWTIRFKMPSDTLVEMDDLIRGHIEVNTDTLDDKVLWKRADKLPTYHLANIVDDHLMEITEVIRGEEWLPSLPLHYMLYRAFGWSDTMPRFAHLPLLLKPDGKGKLSKRDGDKLGFPVFPLKWVSPTGEVSRGYREDGYFPEAFVNMLSFLGWNPGDEREILSLKELEEAFSLDHVSKSGARFNAEKARWFNREYLRMKSADELAGLLAPVLESHGMQFASCPVGALCAGADFAGEGADFENHIFTAGYVAKAVAIVKDRATFVADLWTAAPYLYIAPEDFEAYGVKAGPPQDPKAPARPVDPRAKVVDDSLTAPFLGKDVAKFWKPEVYELLPQIDEFMKGYKGTFSVTEFSEALEEFIKGNEWPMGKVMNCLRLTLTGAASGLGIAEIVTTIGTGEASRRIAWALKRLNG